MDQLVALKSRSVSVSVKSNLVWKRAGVFNKHHLTASNRGGQTIPSNLLRMDIQRHNALHAVFLNFNLDEIIFLLIYVKKLKESLIFNKAQLKSLVLILIRTNGLYYGSKEVKLVKNDMRIKNAWDFLFKDKSIDEILDLFLRLKRFKSNITVSKILTAEQINEILNKKTNVFSFDRKMLV